jgi:hypothetical protein
LRSDAFAGSAIPNGDEDDVFAEDEERRRKNKRSSETVTASGDKNASRLDALVSDSENPSMVDLLSSDDDADDDKDARFESVRIAPRAPRPPPANEESESLSEDAIVIE